jgi:glycoside/pentoside/hexuronide:cation symporter, GPH family
MATTPAPAHHSPPATVERLRATSGLAYGALGMPLAFVALPLYVHLPQHYASAFGVPLATLGLVLLLSRLFDAFTDPLLGRLNDRWMSRSPAGLRWAGAVSGGLMVVGMAALFFPPAAVQGHLPIWALGGLLLTYTAFSQLAIAHQAWAARLGGPDVWRAQIVGWREGCALVGVVLASVLPTWLGWPGWLATFAVLLGLGWLAWWWAPTPARASAQASQARVPWEHPWRHPGFRRLMGVFVLSGLAGAMPATLVLFFIQDRLQAPDHEPLFLATYFVAAAVSMPLWLRVVERLGLARTWLLGMGVASCTFVWAATLGTGDVLGFWWVCALSGLALGTDLALPSALLAGLIAQRGDQGSCEGAYFGWWNLATKLNLALAAGLALPMLGWLGYTPGSPDAQGLAALTWAYAVVPCLIKGLAAGLLYAYFVRGQPRHDLSPPPALTKD